MTIAQPDLQELIPTPERIATARRLLAMHTRICVPEPICHWCLRRWPCPDVRWSARMLTRGTGVGIGEA